MTSRILMIVTSHARMGDTDKPTGLWAEELAVPYYALVDAGADVTLASPAGGAAPIDPASVKPRGQNDPAVERFLDDAALQARIAATPRVEQFDGAQFDALFLPGGHGTMWDLPVHAGVTRAVERAFAANRFIASVCHGAAGLVTARRPDGQPIVKDLRVNAFTDAEEVAVGLDQVVPFMLETRLRALGARFEGAANWQPFAIRDGQLVTGQNPQSSHLVAQALLQVLAGESGSHAAPATPTAMRALLLHAPGPDFQLTLAQVAIPEPGAGEVRLRVRASSLNPVDYKFASSGAGLTLPHVPGIDAVGEIDAIGSGVGGWQVGERVMALTNLYRWGGFADYVVVDAKVLSRLPDALSFEQAATLPCAGLTAWQAIYQKLPLLPEHTVLITAAGGGVGGFAVQLAKQAGARVLATSARSAERLKGLGADAVIDYRQGDVVTQVMALTEGRGVDVVIDLVSAESATSLLPLLRHNGHIVCVVGRPRDDALPAWGKAISVHDVALGFAYQFGDQADLARIGAAGEALAARVAAGRIVPQIQEVIALADVPQALHAMGRSSTQGKVVVRM